MLMLYVPTHPLGAGAVYHVALFQFPNGCCLQRELITSRCSCKLIYILMHISQPSQQICFGELVPQVKGGAYPAHAW